jgi:hypothetical protein
MHLQLNSESSLKRIDGAIAPVHNDWQALQQGHDCSSMLDVVSARPNELRFSTMCLPYFVWPEQKVGTLNGKL